MRTIKSHEEISHIFSRGTRIHTSYLTFIVLPIKQHDQLGRAAFIAGKKLGNAVWRNSAKRRMRALCHDLCGPWIGFDVIFLAKSSICSVSYSKVLTVCDNALKQAKIQ